MSEEQMNSYRLTSMEEPGDKRMAQIMREVAEDARESTRRATSAWLPVSNLLLGRLKKNGAMP